jgi:hypothetical protein
MPGRVVTLKRFTGTTSGANGIGTASTSGGLGKKYRLLSVFTAYSAAPTQAGVTVTLNSGAGAGFDVVLNTGTANARYTNYIPGGELIIGPDDQIDVSAPAGGGVITNSTTIYCEELS